MIIGTRSPAEVGLCGPEFVGMRAVSASFRA